MPNLGPVEIIAILVIVFLLFGATRSRAERGGRGDGGRLQFARRRRGEPCKRDYSRCENESPASRGHDFPPWFAPAPPQADHVAVASDRSSSPSHHNKH